MRQSRLGIILVVIGIFVLLGNFGLMEGSLFLVAVGAAFLIGYMRSNREKKPFGLLVPANILIALGAFSAIEPWLNFLEGPLFFAFMGLAFLGVHFIHQRNGGEYHDTRWAIFTGLGAMAFSAFIMMVDMPSWPLLAGVRLYFWPMILIGGGAYLIFVKPKQKTKEF